MADQAVNGARPATTCTGTPRVFVGSADPTASAEAAKSTTLVWYPKAALTVLDGGHYLPDEAPLALMTAIEKALA